MRARNAVVLGALRELRARRSATLRCHRKIDRARHSATAQFEQVHDAGFELRDVGKRVRVQPGEELVRGIIHDRFEAARRPDPWL